MSGMSALGAVAGAGADYIKSGNGRQLSGWGSAADRVAEQTKRIDEQVSRLDALLSAILGAPPPPSPSADSASVGYASELQQVLNERADGVVRVSDRLEALIERIRL